MKCKKCKSDSFNVCGNNDKLSKFKPIGLGTKIFIGFAVLAVISSTTNISKEEVVTTEVITEEITSFNGFAVDIENYEVVKDHKDDDVLLLTVNYTNTSDTPNMPTLRVGFNVSQNGVAIEKEYYSYLAGVNLVEPGESFLYDVVFRLDGLDDVTVAFVETGSSDKGYTEVHNLVLKK